MFKGSLISFHDVLAKLLFLILPTAMMGYFLLDGANHYFSILQNDALLQSAYVLAGMLTAWVMYLFRFRFGIVSVAFVLLSYFLYKGIDRTAVGEFDTFRLSVAFRIFASLFFAGWLLGSGFSRWRYTHFVVALSAVLLAIVLIARQQTDTVSGLLRIFLPALFYAVYILFSGEQIYATREKRHRFWWYMPLRLLSFTAFFALLSYALAKWMQKDFQAAIVTAAGRGEKGEGNSLLTKRKDGRFDINDFAQLKSSQGRGDELLFAAHIDNYLPGTDIPNPLYLTAFYYTKFDTSTETFERDPSIPKNDLYLPNVAQIPLYRTRFDSSVIVNGMGDKARKVVEVEIYNKKLSTETYLAPNIGFFVQPIAVEKDFRSEFSSAFRAKGYVSELNSAYFIYNATSPELQVFQEQRFAILRKAADYSGVDKTFLSYYTRMPANEKFKRISDLAKHITANAQTPVDKVLAIRDHFLSRDADGNPLFTYTDNPGVPDIPSASKLMYFLFENRKGYCAYYAGATLFLLRSLGIPSRIAVGFMTIDRSDKNKGWYWYYADQAHAWVQVYFPGYGWMDFDTTVGNDDAQESPKPDGTPPLQPPHAWLATMGEIVAVDTQKKTLTMKVAQMLYHDREHKAAQAPLRVLLDVHVADFQRDSTGVDIRSVRIGDSATAVSYAEVVKRAPDVAPSASVEVVLATLPSAIPIDDVYLKKTKQEIREEQQKQLAQDTPFNWKRFLFRLSLGLAAFLIFLLVIPSIVYQYYRFRIYRAGNRARQFYWQYRLFSFYLHQLGWIRGEQTPLQYAAKEIDPYFGTSFAGFLSVFLKVKYTDRSVTDAEWNMYRCFWSSGISQVHRQVSTGRRWVRFLNPLRTLFFSQKNQVYHDIRCY